ncbi:MAG TPA: DUF192 domain-containing protein [Verrucomicrobiae bacterium]|jgi:uncharacterized membrane protein (UPF0127 family)|nr:DUF192 domain-containing protein [Verrucomicrobiae bacterium]
MPVTNLDKKTWLATNIRKADTFVTRLLGLLRRKRLAPEEALWLVPGKAVHTVGMKFPIDVIFIDRNKKVVAIVPSMAPNRATRFYIGAHSILELPNGTILKSCTEAGDRLDISLAESAGMDDLMETRLNEVA